jgi:hypothetical protein
MVGALLGRRGGAAAFEGPPTDTAGTDDLPLLGAFFAYRAATL